MRKLFTIVAMAVMALAVNAKEFTDNLTVVYDGETTTQTQKITVEEVEGSDGLYNISIADFVFGGVVSVGDINLTNVKGDSDTEGFVTFERTQTTISFMNATVTLNEGSRMKGDKLYLDLDISAFGGAITVDVIFGDNNFPKEYTDKMIVTFNGTNFDPMSATINIQQQTDGKYTLQLKNFMIELAPGYSMGIGNITVKDVAGEDVDGTTKLTVSDQAVEITEGDVEGVDWSFGQQLAQANLKATISGEMTDDKLNVKIDLPAAEVSVLFGSDYIAAGIDNVTVTPNESGVDEIYDLSGRKLNEMQKGINIVRKADGTTVKVLKK